jgi:hypothetical protein
LESDRRPINHVAHTNIMECTTMADLGLIHATDGAAMAMENIVNGNNDILLFHHSRWPWGVMVVQQSIKNRGANAIDVANNPCNSAILGSFTISLRYVGDPYSDDTNSNANTGPMT